MRHRNTTTMLKYLPQRVTGESVMYGIGGTPAGGLTENGSTGEAVDDHDKLNERAVAVVQRIQTKLTGRDFGEDGCPGALSVSEQVKVFVLRMCVCLFCVRCLCFVCVLCVFRVCYICQPSREGCSSFLYFVFFPFASLPSCLQCILFCVFCISNMVFLSWLSNVWSAEGLYSTFVHLLVVERGRVSGCTREEGHGVS